MAGINLKNIDLNLLVVFEAIYTAGNISHAADHLAMSQPAVSNALARLRDLIGDPLFVRAARGVEPTGKAKDMIGPVRDALGLIKRQLDGGQDIDLATFRRRFRVLMIDTLEPILMPPVLKVIIERAPGIQIESVSGYRVDFVNEILTGNLDLAFYVFPVNAPEIVTVPICPVEVVFIARRGHPKIGKTLDLETLKSLKQVTLTPELRAHTNIDRDMVAHRVPRDVAYMINRFWSMPAIVERTDLVGAIPRRFVEEISRNFDIVAYEPPVTISEQYLYMLWHAKNEHDPGHKWLREQMLQAANAAFPARAQSDSHPSDAATSIQEKRQPAAQPPAPRAKRQQARPQAAK
jgi:DNA-binding transcriptional LysR family regulator